MAELADALDLGTNGRAEGRVGNSRHNSCTPKVFLELSAIPCALASLHLASFCADR
jgi:hypothetical protein